MQVYETDEAILRSVLEFLAQGFQAGEAAVVFATPQHRAALLHRLGRRPDLLLLDAEESLASFMDGNRPDGNRFHAMLRPVLAEAAQAGNGRVRAYGEMVALLWAQGQREAAIGLEQLWNQVGGRPRLRLLCGHPLAEFSSRDTEKGLRILLGEHDRVHMPESFPSLAGEEELRRHIVLLEQQLRFLRGANGHAGPGGHSNGSNGHGHANGQAHPSPVALAPPESAPALTSLPGREREAAARLEAISAALALLACDPSAPLRKHWIATLESEFAHLRRGLGLPDGRPVSAVLPSIQPDR